MRKILVLGSINIDHSYELDRIVRPGETVASKAYRTAWGGKGLNQAIALAKAGVPKEILPEMNINDFKYLMFNHCAAQKGLGFAKLFQARDENGNPLTRKDRNGKDVPVCTSAKQENVKRFISENPQFKDMMMKMPGADKDYVDALVQKMAKEGLTDMTKELEKRYGIDFEKQYSSALGKTAPYVLFDGNTLRIRPEYALVANAVIEEFI